MHARRVRARVEQALRHVLVASLVVAFTGCSFLTVRGHSQSGPECTTSYAAPFVDLTAVATVGVLLAATANEDECDGRCDVEALTSPAALIGVLAAGSTMYGALIVRGCNNHRATLEADVEDMIASLVPAAEAGACDEVRRAVLVAEQFRKELGMKYALTNPAVLRCLVPPPEPPAP